MGIQAESKKTFYSVGEPKKVGKGKKGLTKAAKKKAAEAVIRVASSELSLLVRELCKDGNSPVVDVDASIKLWMWKDRVNGPGNELAAFLMGLASCVPVVRCVLDPLGGKRHHTKQVSIQRNANREKNKLKAFEAKCELMCLGQLINDPTKRPADFQLESALATVPELEKT